MENNSTVDPALEIVYGIDDRPPLGETMFAALQHLLAIIVGIMTPPLIIANVLGFSPNMRAYLISIALFVSGIAIYIQVKKIGPIGSGLLSIQKIFGSAITTGGLTAILLNIILPRGGSMQERVKDAPDPATV